MESENNSTNNSALIDVFGSEKGRILFFIIIGFVNYNSGKKNRNFSQRKQKILLQNQAFQVKNYNIG